MVKICDSSIVQPLCFIYETCMHTGLFPDNWKKANVFPIQKKESRQLKKTTDQYHYYLSVAKFLRKLFLTPCIDNQLLTLNQSGFRLGDSTICIFWGLSSRPVWKLAQKIYTTFEDFPSRETRAVFLDISEAFDKV